MSVHLLSSSRGHLFSHFCPYAHPPCPFVTVPPSAGRYTVTGSGMGGRPTQRSLAQSTAQTQRSAAALSAFLVPAQRRSLLPFLLVRTASPCVAHYSTSPSVFCPQAELCSSAYKYSGPRLFGFADPEFYDGRTTS